MASRPEDARDFTPSAEPEGTTFQFTDNPAAPAPDHDASTRADPDGQTLDDPATDPGPVPPSPLDAGDEPTAALFTPTAADPDRTLPDPDDGACGLPAPDGTRTGSPTVGDEQQTQAMGSLGEPGGPAPPPTQPISPGHEAPEPDLGRTAPYTPHPHPQPSPPLTLRHPGDPGSWGTIPADGRLEPGQVVFGRYVVTRELGRGGMGRVWLVRHLTLDADRALKMIVPGIAFNPEARARFGREARAMARFTHPNAVTVHDALLTEDVAFIEMEYVRGTSLDHLAGHGRPMPLDWVDRILKQLCDVLQEAHAKGIVHRDLKPSNLMLVDGREPGRERLKVLDFGIAKILGAGEIEGDARTMTNAVMGTPPYMSPEQAEGHSPGTLPDGCADGRCDLYAVGVILYEFLTGHQPFHGGLAKKIFDTVSTPPPPFARINPQVRVPAEVERVVMRCLEKDPANRPQSARELYEQFAAALPKPLVPLAPSPPPAPAALPRRWPLRAATAAAVVVAAGLGLFAASRAGLLGSPGTSSGHSGLADGLGGHSENDPGGGDRSTVPGPPAALAAAAPIGFHVEPDVKQPGSFLFVQNSAPDPVRLIPVRDDGSTDGPPDALLRLADGVTFRRVEGGSFPLGAVGLPDDPERPRLVTVPTLYVQAHEVTNGELRRFLDENQGIVEPLAWRQAYDRLIITFALTPEEADRHPAVGVPHALAEGFASWAGGRLPTSEEWEYIARSRGREDRPYIWGDHPAPEMDSTYAKIDTSVGHSGPPTTTVGYLTRDQTDQGILDLTGNVREWTATRSVDVPPPGPGEPPFYVVRGGSWKSIAALFSTAAHEDLPATEALPDLGFRVVLEVGPAGATGGEAPGTGELAE